MNVDDLSAAQNKPYLKISTKQGQLLANGTFECFLGHTIENKLSGIDDGIFVKWKWDGNKLEVSNDRYGMYPLFYAHFDNQIVISTSIYHVLNSEVPKTLDYEALSILFRLGHVIGDDTPFKHIRVLPANSKLLWCNGELSIQQKLVTTCFLNNTNLPYEGAIDGYIHHFQNAISKRLSDDENFNVPISGGRDSRNILFELVRQGKKPKRCVTLRYRPPATNEDERIARIITDELDIEHRIVEKPTSWHDAVFDDIFLTNFCGGGHSWALPLADYFRTEHITTSYDGLAGGIISAGQTLNKTKDRMFKENKLEDLANLLLNEAQFENFNQEALTPAFYGKISKDVAVKRLVKELNKHVACGNPALSYIFWNRTRRAISSIPFSILSDVTTIYCPYLDYDFFDFCTGLDTSIILTRKFHDDVIAKAYPNLAGIPYQNKELKPVFDKEGKKYYKQAVKDFSKYLFKRGLTSSSLIKNKYIYTRVLADLLNKNSDQPWYLRRALYAYELEKYSDIN